MTSTMRGGLLALGLAGWATGCVVTTSHTGSTSSGGGGGRTGELMLTWSVGAGTCEEAGVTEIEVSVGDRTESFDCDAAGASLALPRGEHLVEAIGRDAGGFARYAGDGRVEVPADATASLHLTMAALPGSLGVTWYFANGRLCAANGSPDVRVTVFDADDYVVAEDELACERGLWEVEELPSGDYGVRVDALDDVGALLFSGVADVSLGKGDHADVEIELAESR